MRVCRQAFRNVRDRGTRGGLCRVCQVARATGSLDESLQHCAAALALFRAAPAPATQRDLPAVEPISALDAHVGSRKRAIEAGEDAVRRRLIDALDGSEDAVMDGAPKL